MSDFFLAAIPALKYPFPKRKKGQQPTTALSFLTLALIPAHANTKNNTMIRLKSIICKLNQLKISDQELYDHFLNTFDPLLQVCPHCGAAANFIKAGSYSRYLIHIADGSRQDLIVDVRRLQCRNCERTHAVLPDLLIPFGCHSLRFILEVLRAYLNRSCSVELLCEHWQIAISTLYRWIHLFIDQYSAWVQILDRIRWVTEDAIDKLYGRTDFPDGFLRIFRFSFFQGLKPPPPVCVAGCS